ncbi:hypothetical protein ACRAWD_30085 [Caulobacter segnis]
MAWTAPIRDAGQKARIGVAGRRRPFGRVAVMDDHRRDHRCREVRPRERGEFYLFTADGELSLLGGQGCAHGSSPEFLGDTRLVQYAARDGLIIPAFPTTPPASVGPGHSPRPSSYHTEARGRATWAGLGFPGGWTQYFLRQPRLCRAAAAAVPAAAEGWGRKLWTAGDREWGQKMQDDKDDGYQMADRPEDRRSQAYRHVRPFLRRLLGSGG